MSEVILNQDSKIQPYPQYIALGRSGFRSLAHKLKKVAFRVGMYVALRSMYLEHSTYVIMITASHNPPQDNGIKISCSKGESLSEQQTLQIQKFVNYTTQQLRQHVPSSIKQQKLNNFVFIGRDCRKSSPQLHTCLRQGLQLNCNLTILDFDIVTTPQLFSYCFCFRNEKHQINRTMNAHQIRSKLTLSTIKSFQQAAKLIDYKKVKISIDCANGANGYFIPKYYLELLRKYFILELINYTDFDFPNVQCGSQFVQNVKGFPKNCNTDAKCVSFDGDGDRIIYCLHTNKKTLILNGDRILSIFSLSLTKIIKSIQQTLKMQIRIGVIYPVISDLGLREYIASLNVSAVVEKLGVQHMFPRVKDFDIGVYFEPSGHGSMYFSLDLIERLQKLQMKTQQVELVLLLFNLSNNNSRGDAFRNMLIFQLLQQYLKLSDSELELYQERKIVCKSIPVKHKKKLISDNNHIIEPEQLVTLIQQMSKAYPSIQTVIRSSETEQKVRIVVQGKTNQNQLQQVADIYAIKIKGLLN